MIFPSAVSARLIRIVIRYLDGSQKKCMVDLLPCGRDYAGLMNPLFGISFMDTMNFLKMVPAVLGIAGLLTYIMRPRKPISDHDIVNILQRARTTFVVLACAALIGLTVWLFYGPVPPDHDTTQLGQRSPLAKQYGFDNHKRGCPLWAPDDVTG